MATMEADEWRALLIRCAMSYDTVTARAMRRALGVQVGWVGKPKPHGATFAGVDRYAGLAECFNQRHGANGG